jgi:Skp family chaperone for outer membrane proteins
MMHSPVDTVLNTRNSKKKSDNKPKAPGGDLHTLLNDVESIRARVEKEIKQQQQEGGKRKRDENVQEEAREESQPVAQPESDMNNYNDELEQLTLSDVHDSDLEGLEPLSEEEFEA